MKEFIFTYPFSGFPFILGKEDRVNDQHYWTLNRDEAIKMYWLSDLSELCVDINITMPAISTDKVDLNFNFSNFKRYFINSSVEFPTEVLDRVIYGYNYHMYIFSEDTGDNPFEFYITPPIYINEDEYEIRFRGEYYFQYSLNYFTIRLGFDDIDGSYYRKYDFTLKIFDKEIPCVLAHTRGNAFTEDELQMSATATINSSWINIESES